MHCSRCGERGYGVSVALAMAALWLGTMLLQIWLVRASGRAEKEYLEVVYKGEDWHASIERGHPGARTGRDMELRGWNRK